MSNLVKVHSIFFEKWVSIFFFVQSNSYPHAHADREWKEFLDRNGAVECDVADRPGFYCFKNPRIRANDKYLAIPNETAEKILVLGAI